jgi:adenylate cyclase class IV
MTVTTPQRNLELKVRCEPGGLDQVSARLQNLVCSTTEHLHQVDTYLKVPHGRLKLREFHSQTSPSVIERAELIAYHRPSESGSRFSTYEVVPISGQHAPTLLRSLLMTHDELVRIDKQRQVAIVGHTRVHLDRVLGLGEFVELETVIGVIDDAQGAAEHAQVITALGLDLLPSVPGSYSDLALQRGAAEG